MSQHTKRFLLLLTVLTPAAGCGRSVDPGLGDGGALTPLTPGQTEFVSQEPDLSGRSGAAGSGGLAAPGGSATGTGAERSAADNAAPPSGRMAEVEEADIYRVDGNRLFYLNTYRGFVVYDVADPQKPQRLSRLPVFGYPIEMFVEGNTVYALLKDALYLTQVGGKLQFERHNVSQLVTIDISDLRNPRVLKTIDIKGHLREGVSRKVENTIYVVSYIPRYYWWGWNYGGGAQGQEKEQAWVYSFDVSDRQSPKLMGELKIFEGGSVNVHDAQTGSSYNRNFRSVALSATANALMVVENWDFYAYVSGGGQSCGFFNSNQQAIVSIVDISDPRGSIKVHTRFETSGALTDQFKMTYVHSAADNTGTFYGIFGRQVWSSADCSGEFYTQNTIESWDVTDGKNPKRLHALAFGKKNEVVRGSAFDVDRQVVYAITAQRNDPLYAISFEDRTQLRVLSEIDGLSGDMTVFRLVGDKQFLLAIGQDNSDTCTGFQGSDTLRWRPTKVAVSIIDVRDLSRIRLVQRQCVAVENAEWISSAVNQDLDQGHKMIGMHSDGQLNVITVPVHYYRRSDDSDWWWYRWETAVGLMTWDLTKYDPLKDERQQSVLENFGTFIHPHGEVKRSIVFTHQGATPRRMMINLSDTHISVADLQDLRAPKLQSVIELAPYYNQVYRFGDYVVEQVQSRPDGWGLGDVAEFRVKRAGGDLDGAEVIASFAVGQVSQVLKHDDKLVLFRRVQPEKDPSRSEVYAPETVALVYDLSDPRNPRRGGTAKLPSEVMPYYRFFCGTGAYWGGYWFDQGSNWTTTLHGPVFLMQLWNYDSRTGQSSVTHKLLALDVRNALAPRVQETVLATTSEWEQRALVADPVDPTGFFMTQRTKVGETKYGDATFARYKHFAQRWEPEGDKWVAKAAINLPGPLVRTWSSGGQRMFLTQEQTYRYIEAGADMTQPQWRWDWRLALLRAVTVSGKPAAELLDSRSFTDMYLAGLVLDGDKLFVNGRPQVNYFWGYGGVAVGGARPAGGGVAVDDSAAPAPQPSWEQTSDRLMIFDLSQGRLRSVYDQPTKAYNVQLMGTHQGKLFLNLQGDGILVIDVTDPAEPKGVRFLRTLGWASHIEFAGDDVYVTAGHFGVFHMTLSAAPAIAIE
jgi:hypothetical protein